MAASREVKDHLCCSMCLGKLNNSVTLQCGHSFCMACVNIYCDQEDIGAVCSCPLCRQSYTPRPVVKKNTVLVDLPGSVAWQSTPPDEDGVSPLDAEYDFSKLKEVKPCLVGLAPCCTTHPQPHRESAAFKRHTPVKVSASQEKICTKHNKLLEVYCRSDGQCICLLGVLDEHKGHDTVPAAAERKDKQSLLGKKKQTYQNRINQKEEQLQQIRQKMKTLQCSVEAAVDQNEKAYAEFVLIANKMRSTVDERIRFQQKAADSQAKALMEQLEKEISELRKEEDELQLLALTHDHVYFLQSCQAILDCPDHDVSSSFNLYEPFGFVRNSISDLMHQMQKITKMIEKVSEESQLEPDPKTRQDFLLYFCPLSLDASTVSANLLLSESNKKVSWNEKSQKSKVTWSKKVDNYPEKFTRNDQVLCTEGLSGVCYWEVEWQGPRVEVAVCYKRADLGKSSFGHTDHAWCISLSNTGSAYWHSETGIKVVTPRSPTVGAYLNHRGGSLSFYSVEDSGQMTLLHRVHTTFCQPLYPGFTVSRGASIRILSLR